MKKTTLILFTIILMSGFSLRAQMAVTTDGSSADASAMLDVKSTDKGILIPRMTAAERDLIGTPATGLMVFVSDDNSFYFYNGSIWDQIGNAGLNVPDPNLPVPIQYQGSHIYVHPTDNGIAVDWTTAQSTCGSLVAFGHDDWYLPGLSELNAMYKQSYLITGLDETASNKYWSDTEFDAGNAFTQRMDYGGPDPDDKNVSTGHNCRCIRQD